MDLHKTLKKIVRKPFLEKVDGNVVEIVEMIESGSGKVSFEVQPDAVRITHSTNKPLIKWLLATKCADGAIIFLRNGQVHIHVVELKKAVTPAKLLEIKDQLDGMILNLRAILGCAQISYPLKIECHIAFETEKITANNAVDTIAIKRLLGSEGKSPAVIEWEIGELSLPYAGKVPFKKIVRSGMESAGVGDIS